MREQISILGRECAAFLFATLFLVLMMSAIYIDVNWMNDAMHETSITETLQEVVLASIAAMFFWSAHRRSAQRGALILIGGFYSCMLIRELDFVFDVVEHGSWIWFALATAAACLAMALRSVRDTLDGLVAFVTNRCWLMTVSGMLIVLVFSRLFGMHQLWQHLMLDGYNRVVKNIAEEGTELLGYSMCWLASTRYLWQTRPARVRAEAARPVQNALSTESASWSS
ncbi:hypothetical protein PANNVG_00027 [Pantoea sp. Nvir]|uniref:hypothetical protein n=1 Tax=Pantoea TaxID=53335 RepID=UPI000CDCE569|nr:MULTISPECIES: hypothetical protein [Pantoea]MCG7367810.1 hypothetical protein [Pantoea sp. ACRSH]MCG7397725.1 hypothetical protein [Pantoea sp. ACRSC]POW55038.1 hypothetical protein C3408_20510 [Pantoea alvi]UBN54483.1 hypothetical protein LB453_02555 [Pantoea agglomerans]